MENVKAKARVQVMVEIEVGVWSGTSAIKQLYKQAAQSGREQLLRTLDRTGFHIIGEPKVMSVITEER